MEMDKESGMKMTETCILGKRVPSIFFKNKETV